MSDPERLAKIKAHLARVTQHGALSRDQLRSDEYLGELVAKVQRQQKLLEELEWAGGTYCSEAACGICGWTTEEGHAEACELAKELHER